LVGHCGLVRPSASGVEWCGWVDDLDTAMFGARLAVIPIRYGSGTAIKALDALSRGVPIVATACGVRGLDLLDGEDALIADTSTGFADACLRLLGDADAAGCIGRAGYRRWRLAFSSAGLVQQVNDVVSAVSLVRAGRLARA
jgi:glycosyltransferase involved in cell wall biosynthesis